MRATRAEEKDDDAKVALTSNVAATDAWLAWHGSFAICVFVGIAICVSLLVEQRRFAGELAGLEELGRRLRAEFNHAEFRLRVVERTIPLEILNDQKAEEAASRAVDWYGLEGRVKDSIVIDAVFRDIASPPSVMSGLSGGTGPQGKPGAQSRE